MSSGAELPVLLALGFVVLGPKRLQQMLGQIARVKAEIKKASREIEAPASADCHPERSSPTAPGAVCEVNTARNTAPSS